MATKRKVFKQKEIIDFDTGQIKISQNTFFVNREPNYFKMYIEDISNIYKIPDGAKSLFLQICKMMDYKNLIVISAPFYDEVTEATGLKYDAIKKNLGILHRSNFLYKPNKEKRRGYYIVNPDIAGKGNFEEIKKIKMNIEYSNDSRTLVTIFENESNTGS